MPATTDPYTETGNLKNNLNDYPEFKKSRKDFWDGVWQKFRNKVGFGSYYHKRLLQVYRHILPVDSRVIELGCGNGKLLGQLHCKNKVGVDFSFEAIELSKTNYSECLFIQADALDFRHDKTYDYIILSDLINDLWDIQIVFENIQSLCHSRTRIILNFYSKLWEGPLKLAQTMGLIKPTLEQNWLTRGDVRGLLYLTGFEVINSWQEILLPVRIPLFNGLINKFLVKISFIRHLALTNFMIARPVPEKFPLHKTILVSVIVAARNEAGHIKEIIERVPQIGLGTELIFVEGNSTDNTYEVIENEINNYPEKSIRLFKQPGNGKGDAVRKGFSEAKGDILMILDADLTVPPEKLPLFFDALVSNKGEFINGVRLVYPMDKQAMRFFNLLGNKFFSLIFSYLLGQRIRDTLCGTKVLWKKDYHKISANRSYFGDFDPFGDFDLIFGAAKLNLKIQDLPVRYKERFYGTTNIKRWKHGWILLRMVLFAAKKLKYK